jgi:hypothetical protein
MDRARTIRLDSLSTPLLNHLDARDAAIWVLEPFVLEAGSTAVAELMRLPWRPGVFLHTTGSYAVAIVNYKSQDIDLRY